MDLSAIYDTNDLNVWLKERDLGGYWDMDEPGKALTAKLWKWDDLHNGITKACEVVPMEQTFRRNVSLRNTSAPANLRFSLQCILPGESAKAHRHSANAIRFIVQGSPKAYSVAEGEALPMEEGDLLTNTHWTWHDHFNESDKPVMWLDSLDSRFANLANAFREDYPTDVQPQTKPMGYTARTLGHVQPTWIKSEHRIPPYRYPWADTYATLMALKQNEMEADPYDGYHLMYRNPETGGPTLPTFACEIQLFTPRQKAKAHRHNCSVLYYAFRGQGATIVDGDRFEWSQGDILLIPPWARHQHENTAMEDAILFSVTDWPAVEALGFYREENE